MTFDRNPVGYPTDRAMENHREKHFRGGDDEITLQRYLDGFLGRPAAGDLLVAHLVGGNVVWERYGLTVPAAGDRNVLTVDPTETVPTWKSANHVLLDGARHSDSLAGTVAAGDVIVGNATPKWSRLARSVPGAAGLLNVIGIANGETVPSWKAAEHNLLSARHSDALADAVVRGDIVYGNATPKWARLAKPAAGAVLGHDATDVAWDTMAWTTVAYNAADYTASAGTWTVQNADVVDLSYRMIGSKTMVVAFASTLTSVSATPGQLIIAIPNGKTAARQVWNACQLNDNGTLQSGYVFAQVASGFLTIGKASGANFAISVNNTNVFGSITFEVQ